MKRYGGNSPTKRRYNINGYWICILMSNLVVTSRNEFRNTNIF